MATNVGDNKFVTKSRPTAAAGTGKPIKVGKLLCVALKRAKRSAAHTL